MNYEYSRKRAVICMLCLRGITKQPENINYLLRKYSYPLALVLVVLAVLYPFTGMIYFTKWDTTNGYLPYRHFVSFFLENGEMPYWNPFQRLGYPGYADLQSGCWYPVTRILMWFGTYDIVSTNIELLSCFVIAALGMYQLSEFWFSNKKVSFLLGLAYSLSGFMTGSTHLMVFLIGVAWFPWIIWALMAYLRNYRVKYAIYLAGFMAMNITGASPAYTILMVYVVLGITMAHVFKHRSSKEVWMSLVRTGWPLLIIFTMMIAPYIISFIEFLPYFNRAHQRPYADMVINPLVPGNWISFLYPYAINDRQHEWFRLTDLSLRDTYIGFATIVMVILGCFRYRKNKRFLIVAGMAILSFWIAMGDETFLYQYLFKLPGFGLFRHPSFIRSYGIFCLILLAGFRLKDLFEGIYFDKKERIILFTFIGVFVGVIIFSAAQSNLSLLTQAWNDVVSMAELPSTGMNTLIWLNGIVTISLLVILFFLKRITRMSWFVAITFFTIADLGLQSRFTGPTTMYHTYPFSKMTQFFAELPRKMGQVEVDVPMKVYNDKFQVKLTDGIQVNYATFFKHVCSEGENPLRMKNFDDAKESGALAWNMEFPLIFLTDTLWSPESHAVDSLSYPNIQQQEDQVKSIQVGFNRFNADFSNNTKDAQWLCLNQNYHQQWKARMDNQVFPIEKVNGMIMGVHIPAGFSGKIEFKYESKWIPTAQWLALIAWTFWLVCLVWPNRR